MANINAEGLIVGRMASIVAKKILNGEEVHVVNAEKAIITGRKGLLIEDYRTKRNMQNKQNPEKSPKFPNLPNLFVRRLIRGMLPWKTTRGKDAFRRLRVYIGNPENLKDFESMEKAKPGNLVKYMTIDKLCKQLGWQG
jgi:large subunit ribosomal protein L13